MTDPVLKTPEARLMTPAERADMERATGEAHAAFDTLLKDRKPKFSFCQRAASRSE
jgi:hypothetical protein